MQFKDVTPFSITSSICHEIPREETPRAPERHQAKGLMSKTIAVHVRYNSLYISMASSA